MIYGLYLSAAGVIASSHRQDVIANNMANLETTGFKRSLSLLQQRPVESRESATLEQSDELLDKIGGGLLIAPTQVDLTQGPILPTGATFDLAILGEGYLAVKDGDNIRLTRNGNLMLDRQGNLIVADGSGNRVLDPQKQPIQLDPRRIAQMSVASDGTITVGGQINGQIGLFDAADPRQLVPAGGTLLTVANGELKKSNAEIRSGFLEQSNVDPASEMAQLLEAQRQLEANANMIRFQDQSLSKLVNEVGKIS